MHDAMVILAVEDLTAAASFYRAAFATTTLVDAPVYQELVLEDRLCVGLYQREAYAQIVGQGLTTGAGLAKTELYLRLPDFLPAVDRIRAAGARELSAPADRTWGEHVGYFADLEGNVIALAKSPRGTRMHSRDAEAADREPTPNLPIRSSELAPTPWSEGTRFGGAELPLSRMGGARDVHVNRMVLPPGRQSCPAHYHLREEEHFYVLKGRCIARIDEERHTLVTGDYLCFPAGDKVSHAFENPFAESCELLAIGPRDPAEIAVYPDSGKAKLRALGGKLIPWPQPTLDYWDGEDMDTTVSE